ncbi:pentatricopeptide repeat-containing protein At5g66520-like [Salvia miltiorrhiza]|uniref:pentatricopeptide repeat-containing protein At5g66520-like n=1 Tax=Salvia miltiorrhiza TaxID=226208 RepID=UPI0025AD2D78|nr:pentatricopeptide repeat-containing protein At5g66520-like [Salvia miltiorrhiza]
MYKREVEQSCLRLLHLCNSFSKLTQIHARILKLGLQNNPLLLTKFTSISSRLNAIHHACSFIFSPQSQPHNYDAFLFNTVIAAFAESPHFKRNSIFHYNKMLINSVQPNNYTYPFLLKACAGIRDLNLGESVHASVLKLGFHSETHVLNAMLHMYCCCEDGIWYAEKVFDEMTHRSSVAWNTMIGGYVRRGSSAAAMRLFRSMQIAGARPDEITMVTVLSACADLGALELGRWVESYVERAGLEMGEKLCNALIDMFAKCGDVDSALRLFHGMPPRKRTIVSWTCVISAMALHGRGEEAVQLFEEMRRAGVVPDSVAFLCLLTACSHSGLVEEGRRYFDSMVRDYSISPRIEHYGCMVDLLSRAGLTECAIEFINAMPMAPNPAVWRALVSSSHARAHLLLGERVAADLIRAEPTQEANYVMLASVYAKLSDWEKKTRVREAMREKGIKKIPGSTMIELGDGIYEFVAGDKSHKEKAKIYEMVEEMERKMRAFGYVSTTNEVLLDIEEEDKEGALNRHSEKLAIAFALLKTRPRSMIRMVKNLRVCGDCHSATKLISLIYEREIVVRDRNRFHHFKDGLCSCKDFW